MIKDKVVLRSEVYYVYSSEQQERMKVYFQLNEKYQQCAEKCIQLPDKFECNRECEKIYDEYAKQLQSRYEGERKELIDAKVKDLPSFERYRRKDRGLFYDIFGKNFSELWSGADERQQKQI